MKGYAEALEEKINGKKAKIGIVGLGYVGLPLAVEFALKGFSTVGIDLDKRKTDSLASGKNYIQDLRDEDARPAKGLSETGPVGQQAAGLGELGEERHRRQPLLTPEDRDARSMVEDDRR